jgi:hypothetical protein
VVKRVLDIAILILLAVAILMPRPDAKVKPSIAESSPVRARVAELQTQLMATPGDAQAALELSGIFMDLFHPEWALPILDKPIAAHPDDHRLFLARSLAFVDHFEAGYAYADAQKALALCEGGSAFPCEEADHGRITLLRNTLNRIKNMDLRKDPNSAKEAIIQGLRMTYVPRKRPKAAPSAAPTAPVEGPAAAPR